MQRKEFLKALGAIVIGGLALPYLSGCTTGRYISAERDGKKIVVRRGDILEEEDFVLIDTKIFAEPVILSKVGAGYMALLLKCTHRGCELEVYPDHYVCPCHGSKFSLRGDVLSEPADQSLKLFPTEWDDQYIYVDMEG